MYLLTCLPCSYQSVEWPRQSCSSLTIGYHRLPTVYPQPVSCRNSFIHLPSHLPTYLTYLPTYLYAFLLTRSPKYIMICLLTYVPFTYLPMYLLPSSYLPSTCLLFHLSTYRTTNLLTYIPTYLPAYLPIYSLTYLLTSLPTYLLTYLPSHLFAAIGA